MLPLNRQLNGAVRRKSRRWIHNVRDETRPFFQLNNCDVVWQPITKRLVEGMVVNHPAYDAASPGGLLPADFIAETAGAFGARGKPGVPALPASLKHQTAFGERLPVR